MALNQDFMVGLDGRTAIWNGVKKINVLAEHKFHETDLIGATFENYDYAMMLSADDVDGVAHGDTFVISDMPDLTLYVVKVDFSDDFGIVRVKLSKQT
jgi:hypothetical protein